ncbi:MAG: YkgJ family cysteine cluster protein [Bdellovibrionales bacterium]|nr:YkgJ family cysteine cluster protein [Bdellovibrionales bacterium]
MNPVDIDRPSTWVPWREGICRGCHGGCCMMPVEVLKEDLVGLGLATEDEPQKKTSQRLTRAGVVKSWRASTGLFQLEQQADRSCVFLDPSTRLCTVYEKRPGVCRKFPREMGPRLGYCPRACSHFG